MRFRSFELTRFGKFTNHQLSFPAPEGGAPDIHVIVGDNEAGKSTFRVAVSEFMYGINPRSTYDFVHAKPDLSLAAEVEHDGAVELMRRIKAAKATLRTDDDTVLAESRLADLFGGLDREAYDRLFALDHEMLVAGGRRLVENKSDLSQLLFEAASGIAGFHERQSVLQGRVAELWKPDGRSQTVIRRATSQLGASEAARRAETVTGPTYEKRRRARRAAERARDAAARAWAELDAERRHLERLRAAAAPVGRISEAEAELATMTVDGQLPTLLPEDARQQVETAQTDLAGIEGSRNANQSKLEQKRTAHAALQPDVSILAAADEIKGLRDTATEARSYPAQIEKRLAEVQALVGQAASAAGRLGWESADADQLAELVPAALARRGLRSLKAEFAALQTTEVAATKNAERTANEAATISRNLDALVDDLQLPPTLESAVTTAEKLGDVEERLNALRSAERATIAETAELAGDLDPWSGEIQDLQDLDTIPEKDLQRTIEAHDTLTQSIADLNIRIAEAEAEHGEVEAELGQRRAQRDIVDRSALDAAREARDAIWSDIQAGERGLPDSANNLTDLIGEADEIADRRFEGAQAIAIVEEKEVDARRLAARIDALAQQRGDKIAEQKTADATWQLRVEALGLGGTTPEDFSEWLQVRTNVLEAWTRQTAATREREAFETRVSEAMTALQAALNGAEGDFLAVLQQCRETLERYRGAKREQVRLVAAREDVAAEDRQAIAALNDARAALEAWHVSWASGTKTCRLPADINVNDADFALDQMDEIESALASASQIRVRNIATMQRDLDAFYEAAGSLAAQLGWEHADADPVEIAQALNAALETASTTKSNADRLAEEIADLETDIETLDARRNDVIAGLAPLFALVGHINDGDLEGLMAAIVASETRRNLETRLEAARREALDVTDGMAIEELRAALAAMPAAQRDQRLAELDSELDDADAKRTDTRDAVKDATDALEAIAVGDINGSAITEAEEERQRALSKIVDAGDDYLDLFVQAKLLQWAIDRYQVENRSPLLERAAPMFQALTCESFADLHVDIGASKPTLNARRTDGSLVGMDGLSSGVEDQLFLALRLAATNLRLEDAPALPFIADDLLVNFDDGRAKAGFKMLADLSRQTQVFYLTHHEHLVDIAIDSAEADINIVRL